MRRTFMRWESFGPSGEGFMRGAAETLSANLSQECRRSSFDPIVASTVAGTSPYGFRSRRIASLRLGDEDVVRDKEPLRRRAVRGR